MAHEIESIAYQGATPWHGLGLQVDDAVGRDYRRFLTAAGLDWQVERVPLLTADNGQPVPQGFATRRVTDQKILGVVGDRYEVLQNEKAFEWFAPFLEAGEAQLHTAGSLRGGSRVWILAKLNRDPLVILPNDVVEKYLLLSHSHDGTLAIRVGFTPIRVVCANTLAASHADAGSQLIRIRHTKAAQVNLEAIRETVDTINAAFEATAEQYRLLAHRHINQQDVLRYVKVVFGIPEQPPADGYTKQSEKLIDEALAKIFSGRGQDIPGVEGTLWAAYNGITEYLSYDRGRTPETRLNSLWYGESAKLNQRALDTALELVAA
jgi:phage/plasmid-like protein (TIGR03299 family)